MNNCKICKFEAFKLKDLPAEDNYYVYILKPTKSNHRCKFLSDNKIDCSDRHFVFDSNMNFLNLPFVQFQNFDHVLKRRFYLICYPVQRKKIWNCSRSCSNFGRKPSTLIIGAILLDSPEISNGFESTSLFIDVLDLYLTSNAIVSVQTSDILLNNFVMDLRGEIDVKFSFKFLSVLKRFIEFNHSAVNVFYRLETMYDSSCLFTSKVKTAAFKPVEGDFLPIFRSLTNLKHLWVHGSFLRNILAKMNYDFGPKLLIIKVEVFQSLDFTFMAHFLKNQSSNMCFKCICNADLDFDVEELHEHFEQVMEGSKRLKQTVETLDKLQTMIRELDLFSSKEEFTEFPSSSLKYLLIPAYLDYALEHQTDRSNYLKAAKFYFRHFLERLLSYNVIAFKVDWISEEGEVIPESDEPVVPPKKDHAVETERKIGRSKAEKELANALKKLEIEKRRNNDEATMREFGKRIKTRDEDLPWTLTGCFGVLAGKIGFPSSKMSNDLLDIFKNSTSLPI